MLLQSPINLMIRSPLPYDAAVTTAYKMNMIFTAGPCFYNSALRQQCSGWSAMLSRETKHPLCITEPLAAPLKCVN